MPNPQHPPSLTPFQEPLLPAPVPPGRRLLEMCMTGELHHLHTHFHPFLTLLPHSLSRPLAPCGTTPLHLACANDDLPLVALLLARGADPDKPNRAGVTPGMVARAAGFVAVEECVARHGAGKGGRTSNRRGGREKEGARRGRTGGAGAVASVAAASPDDAAASDTDSIATHPVPVPSHAPTAAVLSTARVKRPLAHPGPSDPHSGHLHTRTPSSSSPHLDLGHNAQTTTTASSSASLASLPLPSSLPTHPPSQHPSGSLASISSLPLPTQAHSKPAVSLARTAISRAASAASLVVDSDEEGNGGAGGGVRRGASGVGGGGSVGSVGSVGTGPGDGTGTGYGHGERKRATMGSRSASSRADLAPATTITSTRPSTSSASHPSTRLARSRLRDAPPAPLPPSLALSLAKPSPSINVSSSGSPSSAQSAGPAPPQGSLAPTGVPNVLVYVPTAGYSDDPAAPLPRVDLPRRRLPLWDAARLGLKREVCAGVDGGGTGGMAMAVPMDVNTACPATGATALMKAAAAGHAALVRSLMARGASAGVTDRWGLTALVWACLAGHGDCVRAIVDAGGAGGDIDTPRGGWWRWAAGEDGRAGRRVSVRVTPLVAAAYSGSADAVEAVLDAGASVDGRVGPGKGATAITVAAWMKKEDVVRCLLRRGATVDKDGGEPGNWVRSGIVYMKSKASEANVFWSEEVGQEMGMGLGQAVSGIGIGMGQVQGGLVGQMQQVGGSKGGVDGVRKNPFVDTMSHLDAQEGDLVRRLDKMLADGGGLDGGGGVGDDAKMDVIVVSKDGKGAARKNGEMNRGKEAKDKDSHGEGKEDWRKNAMSTLGKRGTLKHKHGLNVEGFDYQTDLIAQLIQSIPDHGTELDVLCLKVYQSVVQLIVSANKSTKHHYVAIVANAILNAGEIVREIEKIEPREFLPMAGSSSNAVVVGASKTSSPSSATVPPEPEGSSIVIVNPSLPAPVTVSTYDVPLFALTEARGIMRWLMAGLREDFPKKVMYATKIAVGVWPPPNAIAEMIQAATEMAKAARRLADVANTTGHWLPNKKLELNVTPFEDSSEAAEPEDKALKAFDYNEYKRRNELKAIEAMSKASDQRGSADNLAGLNIDPNQDFFNAIEAHKKQFATAVQELAAAQKNARKDEYATMASSVHANVDALLDEVNKFDLLSDFSSDIMITKEDSEQLGLALNVPKFPTPLKPLWVQCLQETMNAIDTLVVKAKLASGVWPPPTAATEMIKATIPCVVAVKKLVVLTREATVKIRKTTSEDRKKKEEWRRQWQQNERVKKMFQILENQFWEKQQGLENKENLPETDALNLTTEEEEILKDSSEGLVLEKNPLTGKEFVKGAKLAKLVECLTGHKLPDLEFNSTFLMTHHSFTTSRELLELIIRRYDITPPYGLSQKSFDIFLNKKILPIRIRCCIALKDWISEFFDEDWADDEMLVMRFREFVEKRVASDFQKWSQPLLKILNEKLKGAASHKSPQTTPIVLSPDPPLTPKHITNLSQLAVFLKVNPGNFLEVEPLEMARQVTLVEFEYYRLVRPNECVDVIWGTRRMTEKLEAGLIKTVSKEVMSGPNISKMIKHTNHLTMWVASCIVNNPNIKDRVNFMRYFALFAIACVECNNFNGATGIVAAFCMSPVTRLKRTWELFREKHPKIADQYDQIAELLSPKGQYANYRKALKALQPPVLPFLGVYLTDLTFLELGNQDFLPESHLINFDKRRKAAQIVGEILQYQAVPFSHRPVPALQEFLQSLGHTTDGSPAVQDVTVSDYRQVLFTQDELYDRSSEVEPKPKEESSDDGEEDEEDEGENRS
ncbi:hypothetical protein HDU93_000947 [Gonapodya sp. JEL0774]|nr:hypothetical protein HDU93_000947 [Gonapodya sp. JEL0774]